MSFFLINNAVFSCVCVCVCVAGGGCVGVSLFCLDVNGLGVVECR